ncbi:DUF871 domain-containing protein [Lactobacillus melliventris]|uniref:DUF871 domain-containing protein n=1 Tax=Lactobacillus melliventris TaxID=1218507 RepID=A0ABX5N394_9LACO|nr:MupG family TIM beta-alpha barrel fold protein [Lactobacillus melliventris]PXY85092.1 DUF871 domain-containing protein [Lactobacillus melliventris]
MLGFSMYLNRDFTAADYNYLLAMRNAGLTTVFTSLHIPEDDQKVVLKRLAELTKWCQNLETDIIADVSKEGLEKSGILLDNEKQVKSLGLTGLRIDDGVSSATIAKLSQKMPIALNASTINKDDITALREHSANFENLQAWHNFYPRPETGLDENWLEQKNKWLHQMNLETMAFVAGDDVLRGPIHAGLPTLEKHRDENPLAATLELKQLGCDHIFIGDPSLTPDMINCFKNYTKKKIITLHVNENLPELFNYEWHNRPDVARDVIRLTEGRSRQLFNTEPETKVSSRPKGTITCDNKLYLRYQGELQITKRDLPADERVKVLGKISLQDLSILNLIEPNQKIIFVPAIKETTSL